MAFVPVGAFSYGSGGYYDAPEDYKGGPAVLQRIALDLDNGRRVDIKAQYRVVLPVAHIWQAQAIAVILNNPE